MRYHEKLLVMILEDLLPLTNIMIYIAIKKLMTDKMQNIFYLKAEHYGFIKYPLRLYYLT